ncbi:MAG TPA: EamA family transporter, partial [Actinomycetota bacterium]
MVRPGSFLTSPQDSSHGGGAAPTWAIWAALANVYVVWGSTYLAIRVVVRTMPPFLAGGIRFVIAGALLYPFAARRGDRDGDRPTWRHWRSAAIIGGALLLGGNGLVMWAERTVPSGIASLIIATVPLWMLVVGASVLRERRSWREVAGIAIGFGGVALLVRPSGGGGLDPAGIAMLFMAALFWASGSLYARRASLPSRPLVGTAMQMLAGGVILLIAGVASGELGDLHPAEFSGESLIALGYLVV